MIKTMDDVAKSMEEQSEKIEAIVPSEVKEWGNSAHVPVSKKFIGHKAEVRILKKEK